MSASPDHRPPSPWPGSQHATRHRWQLDSVRSLHEVALSVRALAAELRAASAAGWELTEPMRAGHLLAARPSRRRRAQQPLEPSGAESAAPVLRWRAKLVDEPPQVSDDVLDICSSQAAATPVLRFSDGRLQQAAGPPLDPTVLATLTGQAAVAELGERSWGVAPARVGPTADLVADGSALRIHTLERGALVRTTETLTFAHGADRAPTLLAAAAAYERLARAADAMRAAGGLLGLVDDGLVHVSYPRR